MPTYVLPILPFSVSNGKISFSTIKLLAEPSGALVSVESSEKMTVYLDPSQEPQFSVVPGGGWQSPPVWKVDQIKESGNEVKYINFIKCECQSEDKEQEDLWSLEKCGHSSKCEHTPNFTIEYHSSSQAKPSLKEDLANLRVTSTYPAELYIPDPKPVQAPPKETEDFCPEGGIPVNSMLPTLVAFLDGTQLSITEGLSSIGWSKPYNESVVSRELAKFHNFTVCGNCSNWSSVSNIMSPRCGGCAMQL